MFLSGLDDIDRRLVELLIHNARMSYSDLGQAVGLSRVAVKARVRALEERGVIEEYTTIVNPQKISGAVSCYFELEVEPAQFSAVVNTLRARSTRCPAATSSTSTPWRLARGNWRTFWTGSSTVCPALPA